MSQLSTAAKQLITLTSDFGLEDSYVAQMKGVILTINPQVNIIDITHGVEKFNIRMGAFMLASAASCFPKGTVHLAVVDPGVGTQRRAILVQTKQGFLVGPDNGVLVLAAKNQGIECMYELSNSKFVLPKVSCTFHGRDVFAPAAAYLDKGVMSCEFGPEMHDAVMPEFTCVKRKDDCLFGEVLHIDNFGNVITNISQKEIGHPKKVNINLQNQTLNLIFAKTYAELKPQQPLALIGSHNFLEIALNQANAAEKLHVTAGDKIQVTAE